MGCRYEAPRHQVMYHMTINLSHLLLLGAGIYVQGHGVHLSAAMFKVRKTRNSEWIIQLAHNEC